MSMIKMVKELLIWKDIEKIVMKLIFMIKMEQKLPIWKNIKTKMVRLQFQYMIKMEID